MAFLSFSPRLTATHLLQCSFAASLFLFAACDGGDDPKPPTTTTGDGLASDYFASAKTIAVGEYTLTANYTVSADIVVAEGTTFIFSENAGLTISNGGSFKAIGTAAKPITFRGKNNTDGYWGAVTFNSNSTNNQLAFCKFMHTGAFNGGNTQAAVTLVGGQVSVKDCMFMGGSNYGFAANAGATLAGFSRNAFSDYKGAPVFISHNQLSAIDGTQTYTNNTQNVVQVAGGETFAGNTVAIKKQPVPYFVSEGGLAFRCPVSIEAGTQFTMNENTYFTVRGADGKLTAKGTQAAPIVFTGNSHVKGYWNAVNINSNNTQNTLEYVQISDAGAFNGGDLEGGLIISGGGQANVRSCTFTNNKIAGMQVADDGALTMFSVNNFENNGGYPLSVKAHHIGSLDGMATQYGNQNDLNYIEVRGGDISKTMTWRKTTLPYRVNASINITTSTVSVSPGAQLAMGDNVSIYIKTQGILIMSGSSQDRVKVFGLNGVAGDWGGIVFGNSISNNVISNADISDGGGFNGSSYEGNVVFLDNCAGGVVGCSLKNSKTCGLALGTNAMVQNSNNTFANNQSGNVCK